MVNWAGHATGLPVCSTHTSGHPHNVFLVGSSATPFVGFSSVGTEALPNFLADPWSLAFKFSVKG
jgi:hypothetical protein